MDDLKANKAAAAVAIANEDWESIFNTVTDCITVHDKDFNIVNMNQSARKMLGLRRQDQIPSVKCFRSYHGTDQPPAACPSCPTLETGKPSTREIFEPFLNRHLEIVAIPRFGSDFRPIGLIHIARDITDRKLAEEALRESEKAAKLLAKENELIAEIGRIISSTLNIAEVYERFAEKVREAIPFDHIVVNTVNRQDYTRTARYVNGDLLPRHYIGTTWTLLIRITGRGPKIGCRNSWPVTGRLFIMR